jgi:hypothetical protein
MYCVNHFKDKRYYYEMCSTYDDFYTKNTMKPINQENEYFYSNISKYIPFIDLLRYFASLNKSIFPNMVNSFLITQKMPSFDIVNEIDIQKLDNAINVAKKEISSRYDFHGSKTEVELDKKDNHNQCFNRKRHASESHSRHSDFKNDEARNRCPGPRFRKRTLCKWKHAQKRNKSEKRNRQRNCKKIVKIIKTVA